MSQLPRSALFTLAGILLIGAAAWMWSKQEVIDPDEAAEVRKPAGAKPALLPIPQASPPPRMTSPPDPLATSDPPTQKGDISAPRPRFPLPPAAPSSQMLPTPEPATPEDFAAAAVELDQVSLMLRDYRTRMGGNPEGTNAEIMAAVMGANPAGARLGPPEGQSMNTRGELVDRWGTPYFFHQMSAAHMEIHSAGPDKRFGTEDDVILK